MRKCQKRPIIWQERPITRTKETYRYTHIPEVRVCVSVKRGLSYGKRDLSHAQKRPTDILTYLMAASRSRVSAASFFRSTDTCVRIYCIQYLGNIKYIVLYMIYIKYLVLYSASSGVQIPVCAYIVYNMHKIYLVLLPSLCSRLLTIYIKIYLILQIPVCVYIIVECK